MHSSDPACFRRARFLAQCRIGNVEENSDKTGLFWICRKHARKALSGGIMPDDAHIFSLEEVELQLMVR